jgi:uncharacterized protein (TIGR02145 family)
VEVEQTACGLLGGTPVSSCPAVQSSSSIATIVPSSSSSPSSSSIAPVVSSSSSHPSSSSIAPVISSSSSSSSADLCADFVDEEIDHHGMMKKQFCDARDGKKYVYVTIGEQTWMAENLDYTVEGSRCNGVSANCVKYGRLYNWAVAMVCNFSTCSGIQPKHRGICPEGWHIPDQEEWYVLSSFIGSSVDAKHLKSQEGWNSCGPSGSGKSYSCEDTYGFAALPGGYWDTNYGSIDVGNGGYWWTTSEDSELTAYIRRMKSNGEGASWDTTYKGNLLSVRCLKNE